MFMNSLSVSMAITAWRDAATAVAVGRDRECDPRAGLADELEVAAARDLARAVLLDHEHLGAGGVDLQALQHGAAAALRRDRQRLERHALVRMRRAELRELAIRDERTIGRLREREARNEREREQKRQRKTHVNNSCERSRRDVAPTKRRATLRSIRVRTCWKRKPRHTGFPGSVRWRTKRAPPGAEPSCVSVPDAVSYGALDPGRPPSKPRGKRPIRRRR